jgi:hypothetical protein
VLSLYILLGTFAYQNRNCVSRGTGDGIATEHFT